MDYLRCSDIYWETQVKFRVGRFVNIWDKQGLQVGYWLSFGCFWLYDIYSRHQNFDCVTGDLIFICVLIFKLCIKYYSIKSSSNMKLRLFTLNVQLFFIICIPIVSNIYVILCYYKYFLYNICGRLKSNQ